MDSKSQVATASHSGHLYKQPSPPLSPSHPRTLPETQVPASLLARNIHSMSSSGPTSLEGTPVPLPMPGQPLPQLPPLPPLGPGGFGGEGAAAPPPQMRFVPGDPDDSEEEDDDDDDSGRPKKKTKKAAGRGAAAAGAGGAGGSAGDDDKEKGRRKIEIEYIQKKEKRHITFSKRKAGIMKKAYELATLTGTQVLLLVVSETGIVYTFTTAAFQPLVGAAENGAPSEGQRLIQQCLAVDPADGSDYISPPPDGPLLPLPPKASKRPFETNSAIHGGQIALRTRTHRPSARKGRPAAINTGAPENPPLMHPPHPMDHSPMQLPPSPHRPHPLHQAQHSPGMRDYPSPGLPSANRPGDGQMQSAQEYAEMMQRSQMSNGGGNGYPPHYQGGHPQGEYGMHPHPGMMHHPQSPVERFHNRGPSNHSPHIQHQQIDPSMGPPGGYEDSNMMPMQQGGHPQQGPYMQQQQHHQQQQQQQGGPYEEEYMRR